jgi:uncharacterized membrane protein
VKELLIIGFAEKHRALEVLPQLQQLHFDWSGDLQNAAAVEVERDGGLKLFHGLLLDSVTSTEDAAQWRSILSVILPPPYWSYQSAQGPAVEDYRIDPQPDRRAARPFFDQEFIRDAAALLRPGSSVLLLIVHDGKAVLPVLSGYSRFLLHTRFDRL